jgi:alpha-tubulin suppressor-like RCC1 family protein
MKKILLLLLLVSLSELTFSQKITGGIKHSLYVCNDGTVNSWGLNSNGQLGDGTNNSKKIAEPIPGLSGVIAVSAGRNYSLFLKNDGTVWACGSNEFGQLGLGNNTSKNIPVQVPGLTGITAISGGYGHSLFLKNDGTVWACGFNYNGELGDGTNVGKSSPVQVIGLSGITAIATASLHSLFLKNDGTVWGCGDKHFGQLGGGYFGSAINVPEQIPGLSGITAIAAAGSNSVFLKNNGTVSALGSYFEYGEPLSTLSGVSAMAISQSHGVFLKNDGTVWACGNNIDGQLGAGTNSNVYPPAQIAGLSGIIAVTAGYDHSFFMKNDGTLWACGKNADAQLGDGTNVKKLTPVQITVCAPPQPPSVDFSNFPTSVCLGSNVNTEPSVTGSNPQLATVVDNAISVSAPKTIAKNSHAVFVLDGNDQVLRYGFNGTLQYTYNPGGGSLSGIKSIAVDDNDSVYANNGDGYIYTFNAVGGVSSVQSYYLGSTPQDMIYAPNNYAGGNVIVLDNSAGMVGVNTNDADPLNNSTFYGDFSQATTGATSLSLDKTQYAERRMLAADPQHHKLWAKKYYDASGNGNEDLKLLIDSASTQSMALDFIDADTINNIICVSSSTTSVLGIITSSVSTDGTLSAYMDTSFTSVANAQMPVGMIAITNGSMPQLWIADKGQNKVLRVTNYIYQISPTLPQGLKFNPLTGKIDGTPVVASAPQTYQVIISNGLGADTSVFTFGVTATGPLSNSVGTGNASGVQADGLAVKYYNANNCSKMIEVADSIGGTSPGQTEVTQNVLPIVSVIANDTLIRRVTKITAENPEASANIRIFYTYQDIQLFNQSHGSTVLSNDTTTTMQVAVLQMHEKPDGSTEPIVHSPVTATWSTTDHHWVVNFPVTKFSTFYTGDTASLANFNCVTSGSDSIITVNPYYIWNNDTLYTSGTYVDTLMNANGCDSIATFKLTIDISTNMATPILEKGISLYPNPSSGVLSLDVIDPNVTISRVNVLNLMGSKVYSSEQVNSKSTIDLSTLPKGIYFVQIASRQETITRRIVLY